MREHMSKKPQKSICRSFRQDFPQFVERGWSEMGNAVHEATFVQMELKGRK